ncbi:hypothetical protein TG4357_03718 [Thalassovita gelatinovora]|uniref:Uncharacterized protein n=1 Tax=Thalassovita gelatinovora TaxID=53501 RepID=A0A0P1FKJ0_THAGE|nr:hypothetical protein [Thalassovita gelatinovora]QIZ79052.1 hypothetical protein HFZ77_00465 [Thalassovita gelatinovora]CUH68651.1 hypothetical protein TG4357_03718 [Thalassovita gelatinovora]SEQ56106.1 hypothetical protein SAMN04488043_106179 [Thalassovita gelatinovora]
MTRQPVSPIGIRLIAGHLAGGVLFAASGLFSHFRRARADTTTHDDTPRAPALVEDTAASFHCPEWPGCGCPGGTMHPDCPGLKILTGEA